MSDSGNQWCPENIVWMMFPFSAVNECVCSMDQLKGVTSAPNILNLCQHKSHSWGQTKHSETIQLQLITSNASRLKVSSTMNNNAMCVIRSIRPGVKWKFPSQFGFGLKVLVARPLSWASWQEPSRHAHISGWHPSEFRNLDDLDLWNEY